MKPECSFDFQATSDSASLPNISAAKYKLASKVDEQARLFPELEKEIAERRHDNSS